MKGLWQNSCSGPQNHTIDFNGFEVFKSYTFSIILLFVLGGWGCCESAVFSLSLPFFPLLYIKVFKIIKKKVMTLVFFRNVEIDL